MSGSPRDAELEDRWTSMVSSNNTWADGLIIGTQARILSSLDHLKVAKSSIHIYEDSDMFRGGYGEVYEARLDGYPLPVAVKELRPAGSQRQRLRVEIVSLLSRLTIDAERYAISLSFASCESGRIWTTQTLYPLSDSI